MVAFDVVKSRGGEEPDADATKRVDQRGAARKASCCSPAASTPTRSAS